MPGEKAPRPGLLIWKVFHTPWGSAIARTRNGYTHGMRWWLLSLSLLILAGCQPSATQAPSGDSPGQENKQAATALTGPGSDFIRALLKEDFTMAFEQVDRQNPDLQNPQSLVAAYEAWLARNRRGGDARWRPERASSEATSGTIPADQVVQRLRDRSQLPAGEPVTVYWMLGPNQAKTSVAIVLLTDGTAPNARVKAAVFVATSQEEGAAATSNAP